MRSLIGRGDFWSGLALAALGTYIVTQASGWAYMTPDGPGAGFFPIWYGSIMIVLSLVLVAVTVAKRGTASAKPVNRLDVIRALGCWAAFVASIALMNVLGFMVAFGLLTWFVVAVMARQRQRIALPVAIGGAIGFYLIFEKALDLTLPHGLFF